METTTQTKTAKLKVIKINETEFWDKSIVKKASGNTSRLVTAAKQAGVFVILKIAYNAFMKRK